VLLAEPPRTQFDLNFQVLGFPVRVHPFFWLVGLVMGMGARPSGIEMVIWIFAMFVSILIHELGHALMIRRFGREAHIVLYAMGGLAIEGRPQSQYGSPWSLESYTGYQPPRRRLPAEQILISAAGPGIQFALAGLIIAAIYATGGSVGIWFHNGMPLPDAELGRSLSQNVHLARLVDNLLYINIFWAIMNLLPVLPLDGGQIALQFLIQQDPWQGTLRALWLSVIVGGIVAVMSIAVKETFLMLLFASLAVSSYFTIQQSGGGRRPW